MFVCKIAIANRIVPINFNSFSKFLLLLYRNTTDFCILIFFQQLI